MTSPPPQGPEGPPQETYVCSFCGKSQQAVRRLIAGPSKIFICDECVDRCHQIIADDQAPIAGVSHGLPHTPREIFERLNEYVIGQYDTRPRQAEKSDGSPTVA